MELSTQVRRAPQHLSTRIDDEVIILQMPAGEYLSLNEVGAEIWDLLAEETTAAAIVAKVVAHYDVEEATARADVLTLLTSFHARGLVEILQNGSTETDR